MDHIGNATVRASLQMPIGPDPLNDCRYRDKDEQEPGLPNPILKIQSAANGCRYKDTVEHLA
jgi:hypothetical protein